MHNTKTGETYEQSVEAFVAEDNDSNPIGLAYFDALTTKGEDCYTVTHLPSGFEAYSFLYQEDARKFIEAIAPLTDWSSLTAKDIFEDAELIKKVKAALFDAVNADRTRLHRRDRKTKGYLMQKSREIAGV